MAPWSQPVPNIPCHWHPTHTSHFDLQEKYHIPAPPVQSQALGARKDGWCGHFKPFRDGVRKATRDSSFFLTHTGILGALGLSSISDTTVSPCRQHQDTSQDCPCPHFGMDSTLWSHSRSRAGDNTTAQLSLLGCLLSVPFQHLWSPDQPSEQALSTRKFPNWCPLSELLSGCRRSQSIPQAAASAPSPSAPGPFPGVHACRNLRHW